jgi:hypothetical protein
MSKEHELDFEVLREPWNKYSLRDGSNVKSRYILTKVKKREPDKKEGGKVAYGVEGQNITVTYNVPEELKGPPTRQTYSPQELSQSIAEDDIGYSTLSEEWNEYIVEDGTKIRVKDTIVKVSRTKKTDRNGNPVYLVQHSTLVDVRSRRR